MVDPEFEFPENPDPLKKGYFLRTPNTPLRNTGFKPFQEGGSEDSLGKTFHCSLSIQVCPKKGINPAILLWVWDWDHQTYSREGYGSLGVGE